MKKWKFYATVSKADRTIRPVGKAGNLEMAAIVLTRNWTDSLKARFTIEPVYVALRNEVAR